MSKIKELRKNIKLYINRFNCLSFEYDRYPVRLRRGSSLLNLPHLLIHKISNTLTTSDGKGVVILINGVKSNDSELKLIDKDKIKKVEYYDIPPIRYNASGRLLNVITKDFDTGFSGDFYLAATQFYSMFTPYVSYINGRSKFTLGADLFMNPKRNVKDIYEGKYQYALSNEHHEYAYRKEEQNWSNQNNVSFAYSNLKENSYLFQAKGNVGFSTENTSEQRDVNYSVNNVIDTKNGFLKNTVRAFSPTMDVYYSKKIGENDELNINIVSSLYKNRQRILSEENGLFPFKDESDIEILKTSYIGEVNYATAFRKNRFSFGYKYWVSDAENKITNLINDTQAKSNNIHLQEHSLYAETSGAIKKFSYRVSLGGWLSTTQTSSSRNVLPTFTPMLILGRAINDDYFARLTYKVSTVTPGIQQFSDNSIMLMQNIVRKGNPNLKTAVHQELRLQQMYSLSWLDVDFSLFFEKDKNHVFDFFEKESADGKDFIRLYSSNAVRNNKYGIESNLTLTPFNGLRISGNVGVYNHRFKPAENSPEVNKWFVPLSVSSSYEYKNFLLEYLQTFGTDYLEGMYILGTEKVSYLNLGYSYRDWSFQLSYYFPFVRNKFKNRTIDNEALRHTYEGWLRSKERTFGLSVSWNFNTRIKPYQADIKLNNADDDTGTFKLK